MNRFLHILLALPFAALANVPDADRGAPGAQPPSLSVQPPGSGTRNPEPGARNPQPATKNEEPRTKNQEPETKNSSWSPQPFDRYQSILDRKPFGVPPPAPVGPAAAEAAAPPPAFVSKIALCSINRTPAGPVAVGFVDSSQNPPKSYYVLNGDNSDGFAVLEASFENETATLEKDGVRIDLKMGKGPTVAAALPAAAVPSPAPAAARGPAVARPLAPPPAEASAPLPLPPRPGIIKRASQNGKTAAPGNLGLSLATINRQREEIAKIREAGGDVASYMERVKERRAKENEAKATAEQAAREQIKALAEKITAEQLAKREHEINYQLLLEGARPVSDIVLSPDEDRALVERGLLQ
jgi:hypothetical protein